jgi:Tfp pilus assembly protein PilE
MRTRSKGFTVIEILFVVLVVGAASIIFFVQKHNIEVSARDAQRKTAINAMFYERRCITQRMVTILVP